MPAPPTRASDAADDSPGSRHGFGLRLIAVYKVIQALGLLLAAAAAFHLQRRRNLDRLLGWLEHLSLSDTGGLRERLVHVLGDLGSDRFVALGVAALAYAALFLTEGVGLWLRKHWAEWFTVIATGSLIPLEGYELFHQASWLKFAVLVGNVAIVIYLARVAMQPHHPRRRP